MLKSFNQKGFSPIIILLLLVAGLGISTYLALNQTVYKSKASVSSPSVPIDPNDFDRDGFSNIYESNLGTEPTRACAIDSGDHAWPPDTNNNRVVNGGDVSKLVPFMDSKPYEKRYDLNRDGFIDVADVCEYIVPYFLQSCDDIKPAVVPNENISPECYGFIKTLAASEDTDRDGFTDLLEVAIGTYPFDGCPDSSTDAAWPPDFDNNKSVNNMDLFKLSFAMRLPYNKRYDLNNDGKLNSIDRNIYHQYKGKSCK